MAGSSFLLTIVVPSTREAQRKGLKDAKEAMRSEKDKEKEKLRLEMEKRRTDPLLSRK